MENREMEGLNICRNGPKISHLFFADDNIIFCKATLEECDALQRILTVYEQVSGQQLNRTKTSLCCSRNTPREVQEEIKTRFGAQVIRQHEKYLGLPSLVGRNKRNTFNAIKEKLNKKLASWKEKLLSKAGKEVLIKAVAQAIPTYTISCFKIPDSLCEELTSLIRNFWWGQKQRGICGSEKYYRMSNVRYVENLRQRDAFSRAVREQGRYRDVQNSISILNLPLSDPFWIYCGI